MNIQNNSTSPQNPYPLHSLCLTVRVENLKTSIKLLDFKIGALENRVDIVAKNTDKLVSDIFDLKRDTIRATLLTFGVSAVVSMPISIATAIATMSSYPFIGAAAFINIYASEFISVPCLIPIINDMEKNKIAETLRKMEDTLTHKQCLDMHKIVIWLQDKHPRSGSKFIYKKPDDNGNFECLTTYVSEIEKNEMEACSKFLIDKYRELIRLDKMAPFNSILKELGLWALALQPTIIS